MQVPAQVEYERATNLAEALTMLARYGPEARVLAGGHSLIPMMKLRLAQPEVLIDIGRIEALRYVKVAGGVLAIGALATHADLLRCSEAGRHFAILHDAERVIADPVVREWGTVGGSVCQADPSEDLSAAFAALGATMVIAGRSPAGAVTTRQVPARQFAAGPYQSAVEPAEVLAEVRVPLGPPAGSSYLKVARRSGDWPVGAAGAVLRLDGEVITEAGIGLTALGAPNFAAGEAEAWLLGKPASAQAFAEAGAIAASCCRPAGDQRGTVAYKQHLAAELTSRALAAAAECARSRR